MAVIDQTYFVEVYHGDAMSPEDFAKLEARAEDIVGALTRWQVTDETIAALPELTQTLYKKAVCAQVDFFALNGLETLQQNANSGPGFTVGKVSVQSGAGANGKGGALSFAVSPLAYGYLDQTGLMYPGVPVIGGRVF